MLPVYGLPPGNLPLIRPAGHLPPRGKAGGLSRQYRMCCENCNFVLLIAGNCAIIPVSVLCIHTCLYIFAGTGSINV